MRRGHPQQEGRFHLRDPCPEEGLGMDSQGIQVESRRPLRRVCRHGLGRPELDFDLNPVSPSPGLGQ
jgi:hypothetical protein